MSRTIIAFSDAPNGQVDFKITHVDGFNPSSNAHKLSMQVCKFLDEQCAEKTVPTPETATPEEQTFVKQLQQPILVR
jgi:hypothetical protein